MRTFCIPIHDDAAGHALGSTWIRAAPRSIHRRLHSIDEMGLQIEHQILLAVLQRKRPISGDGGISVLDGIPGEFNGISTPGLFHHIGTMLFNSSNGDAHHAGNLPIAVSVCDQGEDLDLSVAEVGSGILPCQKIQQGGILVNARNALREIDPPLSD